MDPVTASAVNGSNFNRYWYANNNPYRFVDPDGRYTCDAAGCAAAKAGLKAMNTALANPANSGTTNARLGQAIAFYGSPGEANGVVVVAANLPGRTGGDAMTYSVPGQPEGLQTVIRIDVAQSTSDAAIGGVDVGLLVGGTMVHEGVHGIDQRAGGGYIATSRDEINLGEIKATTSEAHYYQASGQNPYGLLNTDGSINSAEVGRAADRSTNSVCSKPDACD